MTVTINKIYKAKKKSLCFLCLPYEHGHRPSGQCFSWKHVLDEVALVLHLGHQSLQDTEVYGKIYGNVIVGVSLLVFFVWSQTGFRLQHISEYDHLKFLIWSSTPVRCRLWDSAWLYMRACVDEPQFTSIVEKVSLNIWLFYLILAYIN